MDHAGATCSSTRGCCPARTVRCESRGITTAGGGPGTKSGSRPGCPEPVRNRRGVMAAETGLIGHWRLEGDCKDASGNGNDGRNLGADLRGGEGACFDGRAGVIEVAASPSLRLGTRDFSVAAWIRTEREPDDTLGDILSKFDPVTRRGFQLGL